MSKILALKRFFGVPDDPNLVQAQAQALARQVPLLYGMLLANTLILAYLYLGTAPDSLTIGVPATLSLISLMRLAYWWIGRHRPLRPERARRRLAGMMWIAAAVAIGFTAWSLALFPYGGPYQKSHVAFYMGITGIGCMFCLMHVRSAVMIVGACVMIPFALFFATSGQPVFTAVSINMLLVVAVLLVILFGNYRDFSMLVASRGVMAQRQAEAERLSEENDRLANVDSLTGLPNRRWFDRELAARLASAQKEGRTIAVARLDLDSFKTVNDIFGQITGDRVLAEVARRIVALRRPSTFVARLGADNYALILQGPLDETSLKVSGDLLCTAMDRPFDLPGAQVRLSASAGFAASRDGDTPESLYDRADYAASVAKRETRGRATVFSAEHARDISKVRSMERALRNADLGAEIYILLQPQFDMGLGRITGYEVLARWRSPLLGEISPAEFIPMAERVGLISKITQTVLCKALEAVAELPRSVRLSVNLSANDLASTTAIEAIVALVERHGRPCRVDFEITETAVMRDLQQANAALLKLLALGSRIALDDFGTGHSSLTYVQRLPLDRIKVDRSFVADVCSDPTSRAIVKTTVDLCRNLGISCVFEGIETQEQLDVLTSLGGAVMQGYLFGRPMLLEDALVQLEANAKGADTRIRLAAIA